MVAYLDAHTAAAVTERRLLLLALENERRRPTPPLPCDSAHDLTPEAGTRRRRQLEDITGPKGTA